MSEEMALALANFCLASLDSETGADTSAFLLLGSLNVPKKRPNQNSELTECVCVYECVFVRV